MVEKEHQPAQHLYVPATFYMLRAPALPAETFFQLTTQRIDGATDKEAFYAESIKQCYRKLQSLSAQESIEYAVAIASFSLFDGLERIRRGDISRKSERVYSRLLRYIVRMCTRPTPFGMFAGVAMGTFADHSDVQLASPVIQRIRTRPDMKWLFAIINQAEKVPEIVAQLQVTTNQLIQFRGGRAFLPNADIYGQGDARALSMRATPPVLSALERARQPIRYADLCCELIASFPRATKEQVDRLLWQLWENHFLLSNLLPPLAHEAPAHYILDHLSSLQGAESTATILQAVLEETEVLDRVGVGGSVALLRDLARHQEQLVPSGDDKQQSQLQIDALLSVKSTRLHQEIGTTAARVAETLLRLGRFSNNPPRLEQYLAAFQERYGISQEVPLLDLLSPEKGLDPPPTYLNPPRTYPLFPPHPEVGHQKLDAALCNLVTRAVNDRCIEIELTDNLMQEIEQWSPKQEEAPPSLDIYLQIHAQSQEALDRGEWRAAIGPNFGTQAGGRTFGRFFDMLDQQGVEALKQFTQREEALYPDVIFAELSYLPPNAHVANVITQPGLRAYEIVVGTTPSVPFERVIQLDDLVVGVRNQRFYVRSLRLEKEVIACQGHMLNPLVAPNVCRFLLEVAQFRFVGFSPFNWGRAVSLPFLPRLTRGKVVLSPAQWNLAASTIQSADGSSEDERWLTGLQRWRTEWRVPRYVYLTYADNRLLLDLEHPLMARELQMELVKATDDTPLSLVELWPDFEHLWLEDDTGAKYFSEIVVPLIRADALSIESKKKSLSTSTQSTPRSCIISQDERSAFPGDAWVYLKLYAAYKQHDELIAGPIRELVRKLLQEELIDQWFYIRYCDSAPHLRLRLHTHPSHTSHIVMAEALAWSRQLAEGGQINYFSLDTYEREVERYGGPKTIEAMEQLFTADSVTSSDLVAAQYNHHITIDPEAIAVFSLDTLFAAWGLSLTERLRWLQRNIQKYETGKEFHKKRQLLCDLLAPWEHTRDSALIQQRALLCQVVARREPALKMVSAHVHETANAGDLWMSVDSLLGSLAHMHINRLLGVDRQREQHIYAFWRQTLESLRLRPTNKN
jgi:lantibiotic biosynthesis protein